MRLAPTFAARTARELRQEMRAIVLIVALAVFGLAIGAYLVAHQRIQWPSWMPLLGTHYYTLNAEVTAVSGVLPGEGQAVTVSGVTIGEISGLTMRDGLPVVTMKIDPQYGSRIYSDASVLLRPKTGLEDMVAQLDPGGPGPGVQRLPSGATISSGNTLPTVQLDEILGQLDSDTRMELADLILGAGQAVSGKGGAELGNVLRDFDPLSQDAETASHLVAQRSAELTALMTNLSAIATDLGDNEDALTTFVRGNAGVWHAFAAQDASLQQTIALLPRALTAANGALEQATTLGHTMQSTFAQLDPAAKALGPALEDLRPFFGETEPVLADDLRPFSEKAQPTAAVLAPATERLARSTPELTTLASELNNIVNELAYKPKHGQGYLFYLPWDSHDTDSSLSTQDGLGPLQQTMLLFNCGTLSTLQGITNNPSENPTLATIINLLDPPSYSDNCSGTLPKTGSGR